MQYSNKMKQNIPKSVMNKFDLTGKNIVVSGGAGFLGSHLCEKLLEHEYDVICADNLFTGSKENILHLMDNPYFEFLRHDITFPLFVELVCLFLASIKGVR